MADLCLEVLWKLGKKPYTEKEKRNYERDMSMTREAYKDYLAKRRLNLHYFLIIDIMGYDLWCLNVRDSGVGWSLIDSLESFPGCSCCVRSFSAALQYRRGVHRTHPDFTSVWVQPVRHSSIF